MKLAFATSAWVCVTLLVAPPAVADHCGEGVAEELCVHGQESGFEVEAGQTGPGQNGQVHAPGVGTGGGYSGPPTETKVAPTCTGNSPYGDMGVLCNAALTCPDESEVRFWKWQRQEINGEWTVWRLVDTVCLGADDPQVDPAVAIPGIVQRDFQSVVVMKGGADISPKPETLVNVVTKFQTDAPASYDIPLSILGQSVVITAKAESYSWHFGDGQSKTSYEPSGYAEYTYGQAAPRQAYVVITWSGSFTINGGASQPIAGTVSTQGAPTDVVVRQARSELVRD